MPKCLRTDSQVGLSKSQEYVDDGFAGGGVVALPVSSISMSTTTTTTEEKKLLLGIDSDAGKAVTSGTTGYGALGIGSPRLCLVFDDTYLGGKRSAWLGKLKHAGFEVEQASPRYVAISAPEDMLHKIALSKGSHGAHTMPATRERALHYLLSQFDDSLGSFLAPPGPFSGKGAKVLSVQTYCRFLAVDRPDMQGRISNELREAGLVNWFWLHNAEAAATISPRHKYLGLVCLSRQPLNNIRDYFGTQIAWSLLLTNFLARWLLIPAVASVAYTYAMAAAYLHSGTVDNIWLPVMSVGLLCWSLVMLFFWWRLKTRYEIKWLEDVRVSGREDLNTDAEFEERVDPELGDVDFYYPLWKQRVKQATTLCMLILPMMGVIAAGLGVLELRSHLVTIIQAPWGGVVAGLVTAVVLLVLVKGVCGHWSAVMTHWENYTRRSMYYNALGVKIFSFEMLANLFPVLYLAVLNWPILSRLQPANEAKIVDALTIQATTVFVALCGIIAVMQACRYYLWQQKAEEISLATVGEHERKPNFSHIEQANRPAYPGVLDVDSWTGVLLIYSLVLAPICPVAPLVCFLWILARSYTQTHELLYVYQRPHPHSAAGGGFWTEMPFVVVLVAFMVHIPLVLFCTTGLSKWAPSMTVEDRWGALIGFEAIVVLGAALIYNNTRREE